MFRSGLHAAVLGAALLASLHAAPIVINSERIRLGEPDTPEWAWFEKDRGRSGPLELKFQSARNPGEATLFVRQQDVKLEWRVHLNGKLVGKLSPMEADLIQSLAVPAGALRDGENVLTIIPPIDNTDDIVLREIALDPRPVHEAVHEAALEIEVKDRAGNGIPVRITIADENGCLMPVVGAPGQLLAVRPGVVYTGTGKATVGVRSGRYTIYASRGFEYGVDSKQVEIRAGGKKTVLLQIAREVETPGLVSCDPHIHTLELSKHGDAMLDERMLTVAGEGIELPVATEHNQHADYSEAARRTGMAKFFTPVRGNEVTTSVGHFNIFPVAPGAPVPNARATDWPGLLTALRATPGVRVVTLNHPRSVHNKFRPFGPENFDAATGQHNGKLDFSFNAIESINSGAQQTDYMLVFRDWFALLNRGYRITALGASDSHDVSRFIVGQSRTYIAVTDDDPGRIDVSAACESVVAGRAYVSMGLLPEIRVEDRWTVGDLASGLLEKVRVRVRVLGPSWIKADRVELYANGVKIEEAILDSGRAASAGEKLAVTWTLARPRHDTHLVAIATGPEVKEPFWAMTRPYQPASPHWEGRAIGLANPVWLDVDDDGKFSPPANTNEPVK